MTHTKKSISRKKLIIYILALCLTVAIAVTGIVFIVKRTRERDSSLASGLPSYSDPEPSLPVEPDSPSNPSDGEDIFDSIE